MAAAVAGPVAAAAVDGEAPRAALVGVGGEVRAATVPPPEGFRACIFSDRFSQICSKISAIFSHSLQSWHLVDILFLGEVMVLPAQEAEASVLRPLVGLALVEDAQRRNQAPSSARFSTLAVTLVRH